ERRLAVDIAEGGGNFNAFVLRHANTAKVILKYQTEDTMDVATKAISFVNEHDIMDQNLFVDAIGVGRGVYDFLRASHYQLTEVKGSEQADDPTQFSNKRAEMYWRLRLWIKSGGRLEPSTDW